MNDKKDDKSDKKDRSNVIAPGQKRDELKPGPKPPPGSKPKLVPDKEKK